MEAFENKGSKEVGLFQVVESSNKLRERLLPNVARVPDITEQALAVKDFHYLSRMKPFLRFYMHRQKNANGSKFGLFL